jgi:hypothetical protein
MMAFACLLRHDWASRLDRFTGAVSRRSRAWHHFRDDHNGRSGCVILCERLEALPLGLGRIYLLAHVRLL